MNISDENCDEIFDVICIGYGFAGAAAGGADHDAGAKFIDADPGIFTETVNRWNANVTEGRDSVQEHRLRLGAAGQRPSVHIRHGFQVRIEVVVVGDRRDIDD
ncbi:MAG: hypothetical protein HOK25_04580 [Rhodospirillaceae bacterium]|nr:hypothetical protein [Rhodospirillaceae bacterium]